MVLPTASAFLAAAWLKRVVTAAPRPDPEAGYALSSISGPHVVLNTSLLQVPGGYLSRLQDGDLKYLVAFPSVAVGAVQAVRGDAVWQYMGAACAVCAVQQHMRRQRMVADAAEQAR